MPTEQPSGLLLFDKPAGITSHDAVDLLRRKLGMRRIGHGGTLDPMATGLLILLAGAATSAQASVQRGAKVYAGTAAFGAETDTWDAEGKVTRTAPVPELREGAVAAAVAGLSGRVVQRVPPYSAVRVGGKQLYKLARAQAEVPEVRREVELRWLSWSLRPGFLDFEIESSGGAYIRSVAVELGLALGTPAHLCALRRLSVGAYHVREAVTRERLAGLTRDEAAALLVPPPEL